MSGPAGRSGPANWPLFAALALVIFALDQLTKSWIVANIRLGQPVRIVDDYLRLSLSHNDGALFGLFREQALVFATFSVVVIGLIVWYQSRVGQSLVATTALGLLLGGAFGNLADRLQYDVFCWSPSFVVLLEPVGKVAQHAAEEQAECRRGDEALADSRLVPDNEPDDDDREGSSEHKNLVPKQPEQGAVLCERLKTQVVIEQSAPTGRHYCGDDAGLRQLIEREMTRASAANRGQLAGPLQPVSLHI